MKRSAILFTVAIVACRDSSTVTADHEKRIASLEKRNAENRKLIDEQAKQLATMADMNQQQAKTVRDVLSGIVHADALAGAMVATQSAPQSVTTYRQAPPPQPPIAAASMLPASTEYARLEREQRERNDAFEKNLSQSVFSGPDGAYHSSNCDALWISTTDKYGITHRDYAGRTITLREASQSRLPAHGACNPPSYAFTYR